MTVSGHWSCAANSNLYQTIRSQQIQQIERDTGLGPRLYSAWAYTCSPFTTYSSRHVLAVMTDGLAARTGSGEKLEDGNQIPDSLSSLGFLAATFTSAMIAASPVMASPG